MIRGVIFDLGGTLAAPLPVQAPGQLDSANAAALLRWLRGHGARVDDGFVDALLAERRASFARATGLREAAAAEALRSALQRYGLAHDEQSVAAAEAAFFEPEVAMMRPLQGAEDLLRWIRGMRLRAGVASNASSHYLVVEICRRLGFASFFDPIVSSAGVGWAKPHRRIFETILCAWSLSPGDVVMVGDTPSADVAGARGMGMRSILLATVQAAGAGGNATVRPDAFASGLPGVRLILEEWSAQAR